MIQETKVKRRAQRIARQLLTAMLASCLTAGLIGCALMKPRATVIDPNTQVIRLTARTNYAAPCNGYFVPDATMLRVLDRLTEKDVFGPDAKQ